MKWMFNKKGGCSEAELLIQRSLDEPLSPAERHRLDEHLATCESCRAAWEEYRRLSRTASQWVRSAVQDPGDDFTQRVLAELGLSNTGDVAGVPAARPVSTRKSLGLGWGVGIAAAVVAVFVVAGMFLPPIAHYQSTIDSYTPSLTALTPPTTSTLPQMLRVDRPEFGDALSTLRSWTWPLYAFAVALVANVALAGMMARHRRRAL